MTGDSEPVDNIFGEDRAGKGAKRFAVFDSLVEFIAHARAARIGEK